MDKAEKRETYMTKEDTSSATDKNKCWCCQQTNGVANTVLTRRARNTVGPLTMTRTMSKSEA